VLGYDVEGVADVNVHVFVLGVCRSVFASEEDAAFSESF